MNEDQSLELKYAQFKSIKSEGENLYFKFHLAAYVMNITFNTHKVMRALLIPFLLLTFIMSSHNFMLYSALYIGTWAFLRLVIFELSVLSWNKLQVNSVLVKYLLLKRDLEMSSAK